MQVLIADDDDVTRCLLTGALQMLGHETIAVANGEDAWRRLSMENPPRMLLLDWMMPGLNGLELCRRLRDRHHGAFIYVILVTAQSGKRAILEGLEAGAHDYLEKPFEQVELRIRIEVGMRILRYEDSISRHNADISQYAAQMQQLAEERARQLMHSDRMATLGVMSTGIAHEINNPASFISGNIQVFQRFWPIIALALEHMANETTEDAGQLQFVLEEGPKALEGMRHGVERIANIVRSLKRYAHQGDRTREWCNLNACIELAMELCHNSLKRLTRLERRLATDLPDIMASQQEIEQVFVNLLTNAADAMGETSNAHLLVETRTVQGGVMAIVEDNGPGIPDECLDGIFKPFYTTKKPGKGTGLGLAICDKIITQHLGGIDVETAAGGGARFKIFLPVNTTLQGGGCSN